MTGRSDLPADRFTAAFETHHRRVLAYALRRTRSEQDAEDVVAETFAIAWRRIEDLPSPDAALPWLLAVARRVAANQRRGGTRWQGLIARIRSQPQPHAAEPPATAAQDALARLPADDQELLRLLAWDGLTQAEAGTVLGITPNAVAIRLHRARKRFADQLARIELEDAKGSPVNRTPQRAEGRITGRSNGDAR